MRLYSRQIDQQVLRLITSEAAYGAPVTLTYVAARCNLRDAAATNALLRLTRRGLIRHVAPYTYELRPEEAR